MSERSSYAQVFNIQYISDEIQFVRNSYYTNTFSSLRKYYIRGNNAKGSFRE